MRRKILFVTMFFFVLIAAVGCTKNTANDLADKGRTNGATSGSAVSGAFISGTSVHTARLRYANDWNIYEGDCDTGIYLYDLSGQEKKRYDVEKEFAEEENEGIYMKVLWVDNDWLFLSCHRNQEKYEIWQVPLEKKDVGKFPNFKRKEKLIEVKRWGGLIDKTEHTIIYCANEKICKLDLRTKKKQELNTGISKGECSLVRDADGNPFFKDGKVYCDDNSEENMYQIDLIRWESTKLGVCSDGNIATDGVNLYFMQGHLVKYNANTGEKKKLFSADKLSDKIDNLRVPKTTKHVISDEAEPLDISIERIFYYNQRLYLSVEVEYEGEGDDDEFTNTGSYARVMYSCLAEDGSDLKYEKEITEYLWQHSSAYTDAYAEAYWTELSGDFSYLLKDSIVLHFYDDDDDNENDDEDGEDYEDDEGDEYNEADMHRFVLFNLRDKSTREIVRPSDEYGYLKAVGYSFYEEAHC